MNNYITLDGYKYACSADGWAGQPMNPSSAELMLSGASAVTFGPASFEMWSGPIKAPVTARGTGWGTITQLRATVRKRSTVSFTDHYGDTFTVLAKQTGREKSTSPMWDAASNEFKVPIELKEAL